MAEMVEKRLEERREQAPDSDYELRNVKTIDTVSTTFALEEDPDFRFGFTRIMVFIVRSLSTQSSQSYLACNKLILIVLC